MRSLQQSSRLGTIGLAILMALAAGCGGGGTDVRGGPDSENNGSDDDPGGDGSGTTDSCGIPQATGLTSPGPAEGAWGGLFPIFGGIDAVPGNGIVGPNGDAAFIVGHGELWVGSVLAAESGAVQTMLRRYARLSDGAAGGQATRGIPPAFPSLVFGSAVARTTLKGAYKDALSNCQDIALGYNESYLRPASLEVLAGVYTASEDNGYTLTVTVHDDGSLDGADTNGCVLIGSVSVPDSTKNFYRAVADASTCGSLDGHYEGMMSRRDLTEADDSAGLFLSLSRPDTAIFYTLAR